MDIGEGLIPCKLEDQPRCEDMLPCIAKEGVHHIGVGDLGVVAEDGLGLVAEDHPLLLLRAEGQIKGCAGSAGYARISRAD